LDIFEEERKGVFPRISRERVRFFEKRALSEKNPARQGVLLVAR
jgi:hypothetical protein